MKLKLVKILPLLVTVMLLGFTSCTSHVVKTDTLNVRATPSKNGKVIGKLHRRDRIDVILYNDKWGEIEFEDKKGYVATEYLCTPKENFIGTLKTIGIIAGCAVLVVGLALFLAKRDFFGPPEHSIKKTKSWYANKIAEEERILASWKADLALTKDDDRRRRTKASIERKKGLIASLKAEMKTAPKD